MPEIHGNTEGIKAGALRELETLYDVQAGPDEFVPQGVLSMLCGYSASLNRELAVYITRYGEIADVLVGKSAGIDLPDMRLRRSRRRLSMIRCVHTHPGSSGELSDVDISALISMRLDAIAAVGVDKDGRPTDAQAAFLDAEKQGEARLTALVPAKRLPHEKWLSEIEQTDESFMAEDEGVKSERERAVLVGIESEASLEELRLLAQTAGAETVGTVLQKRSAPDKGFLIGKGKAEELSLSCQALNADLCIFDEELTGVMQKNLEELLRVKVVDRTTLILDIFALRANTREGKLQVEIAQLGYRSQRLLGQGLILSRLAGGIGTRGPGESKLEVSRRRIRERLVQLERELDKIDRQRSLRRQEREKNRIPIIALVGYTNAGKSTLFNQMTGSSVYVEDKLFATLDAVTRPITLPCGERALVSDTVGFIRKLPHELVKAFRATLEEARLADVIVIVSDASGGELMRQHATVLQVLDSLGATEAPRIDVLNKTDILSPSRDALPGALPISALTGEGVGALLSEIEKRLSAGKESCRLLIPFSSYNLLSRLHDMGGVVKTEHTDAGVLVDITALPANIKIACEAGARLISDENT